MNETKLSEITYKLNFGIQVDLNHPMPIINKIDTRFYHSYILGKTGMGKSVLIERMIANDIKQGVSVIMIDPKGESCKRIYKLFNGEKLKYVSIKRPIVINPLNRRETDIDTTIAEFVQILDILITLTASNPESTVLMREIVGMALRTFNKDQKNLSYLVDFLLYPDVRKRHLEQIENPAHKKYWIEFDIADKPFPRNKEKIESAKRLASRLIEISEGSMRLIVEGENELYINELVERGESLLVDTSKMTRTSRIYLSNLIVYSVLSYCEYYEGQTKPLIIYVDEFQTVVSPLFTELLARSRGKKVGFVLAHHDFKELSEKVISSILGNANTIIVFRCGLDESETMAKFFGIPSKDLLNLDDYHAWVRIGNKNTLVETLPPIMEEVPDLPPNIEEFKDKEKTTEDIEYFFLSDKWIMV